MDEVKAYKSIIKILETNSNLFGWERNRIVAVAEGCIYANELKHEYNLNIDTSKPVSKDWHKFSDYISLGFWDGATRKISWSDDGRQPKNELLMQICVPQGAYIFGSYFDDDYPVELFNRFFNELKSYEPKYIDSANKALYFPLDVVSKVFNEFNAIIERYTKESIADAKKRKAEKLRKDAEKLESEL